MILSGCHHSDSSSQQASRDNEALDVHAISLKSHPFNTTLQLPGRAHAYNRAEVRPQVNGIILKRFFKEGQRVVAGQQLYQIDPARYEAARSKAAATLFSANAQAQRDKPLAQAGAISHQAYDNAVAAAEEAAANLRTANINLGYTQVKAPLTGIIGRSAVTKGALVTDGQANELADITQLDPIYIDLTESYDELESQRKKLADGQLKKDAPVVELTMPDGSSYPIKGRLDFSEVNVDESTESVTLRATFDNPDQVLLPGMFVTATVQAGTYPNALVVPQQAIVRDSNGKPTVYIVDQSGAAKQVPVVTGAMVKGSYLILNGLTEGESVIVDNLQSIHDGQKVNVLPYHAANVMSQGGNEMSYIDPAAR